MNETIPINLAIEDELSENTLRRILKQSGRNFYICNCFGRQGKGFLSKRRDVFYNASKGSPFVLLVDLNNKECAPLLVKEWYPYGVHNNLIFRIAIREVESWLFAHKDAFANFLGVNKRLIPENPDDVINPKKLLIEIASKSRNRELREAIVPNIRSTAKVGPDYNGALLKFVQYFWDVNVAKNHSPSLRKAFNAILNFQPIYRRLS